MLGIVLRFLGSGGAGCFLIGWLLMVRVRSGRQSARSRQLGVANESLRRWYEQHLVVTAGRRRGFTREEHEEVDGSEA